MRIADIEKRFRRKLKQSGIDLVRPILPATWEVFKGFAGETVDSASDGLLFESGTYRFTGTEQFTVSLVRQFEVVDDAGDHEHYVHLRCEFLYEPTDELRSHGSFNLWCFPSDGDSIGEWVDGVESRIEFQSAVRLVPVSVTVSQEQV